MACKFYFRSENVGSSIWEVSNLSIVTSSFILVALISFSEIIQYHYSLSLPCVLIGIRVHELSCHRQLITALLMVDNVDAPAR